MKILYFAISLAFLGFSTARNWVQVPHPVSARNNFIPHPYEPSYQPELFLPQNHYQHFRPHSYPQPPPVTLPPPPRPFYPQHSLSGNWSPHSSSSSPPSLYHQPKYFNHFYSNSPPSSFIPPPSFFNKYDQPQAPLPQFGTENTYTDDSSDNSSELEETVSPSFSHEPQVWSSVNKNSHHVDTDEEYSDYVVEVDDKDEEHARYPSTTPVKVFPPTTTKLYENDKEYADYQSITPADVSPSTTTELNVQINSKDNEHTNLEPDLQIDTRSRF